MNRPLQNRGMSRFYKPLISCHLENSQNTAFYAKNFSSAQNFQNTDRGVVSIFRTTDSLFCTALFRTTDSFCIAFRSHHMVITWAIQGNSLKKEKKTAIYPIFMTNIKQTTQKPTNIKENMPPFQSFFVILHRNSTKLLQKRTEKSEN